MNLSAPRYSEEQKKAIYQDYERLLKTKTNEQLIMGALVTILVDMQANMDITNALYTKALANVMESRIGAQ